MLDLSKAYGIYEGVVFYGDHQNENVIYYFPTLVSNKNGRVKNLIK